MTETVHSDSGLERLNEQRRADLLREFCRECPRLNDARLTHDPGSVGALMALVQQQAGLALVTSRSDKARTFLVTAMAHSGGGERRTSGIDVHATKEFLPVSGVFYLGTCPSAVEVRAAIRRLWPVVVESGAQLLIFDGVWGAAPEFLAKIAGLARTRNVIVADDIAVDFEGLPCSPGVNATKVSVEHPTRDRNLLTVRIQSL